MNILFVHQNFPGQYKYLAPHMAAKPGNTVVALGEKKPNSRDLPGLHHAWYPKPKGASGSTHHYIRNLEACVRRGQSVFKACRELRGKGFVPDVVCCNPGWGEGLFLREAFPEAKLLFLYEFFYRFKGSDVNFDPEYTSSIDDALRTRIKNASMLLSLEACDMVVCPTEWQRSQLPKEFLYKAAAIHDGINTRAACPDKDVVFPMNGKGPDLTANDEVITFVNRNLEPYRGFHVFMRALPKILEQRPKAQVLILGGDGVSYGRSLPKGQTYRENLTRETGLSSERVHFLGRVPYATFIKLLQVSSVHVYLTYPFVLSWSMLEAMSAGCALVASATPPVQEIVKDGQNGLLVDFFDQEGLARRIGEVLDHPDRMKRMRKQARKTIVDGYDLLGKCLPENARLIDRLAQGRIPVPTGRGKKRVKNR